MAVGLEKHGGGRGDRASAWLHIGVRKQGRGACKDDSVVAGWAVGWGVQAAVESVGLVPLTGILAETAGVGGAEERAVVKAQE